MRNQFLTRCVVAWLIGWLPLVGVLASTMPINTLTDSAGSAEVAGRQSTVGTAVLPCHQANTDDDATEPSCNHCLLCHIAGAIVPPTLPVIAATAHHDCPRSIDIVSFTSFIPELPQRPPTHSQAWPPGV